MTQRLGHLVEQVTAGPGDDVAPFVALENLGSRTGSLLPNTRLPLRAPDPTGMTGFRAGDVLFGKLRPYLAKSWRADRSGNCSTELIVMRARAPVDDRWLAYLAQSDILVEWAVATSEGVKMPRTSWEKMRLLPVVAPAKAEQRAIAEYLDAETARIDALVSHLRRLLALVLERHTSFRDSMVDADAGGIRRRLSSVLSGRISDGPHETPEFVDDGVPFLSVDNIIDDGISFDGCRRISEAAHLVYARKSFPRRGDVLVTKAAAVGRVALVETDRVFNVWSPLAILRPDKTAVLPEYLHAALLGGAAQSLMKLASTSNTQENLSMRDLAALRIAVPSLRRQAEVVAQVVKSAKATSVTASALGRQIALLLERRQAVISASVVGQLDLPRVAA